MNIVVDEILSNIVKYAYEKDANYQIEVIFEVVNPTKIKLRFVDRGKSFNPIKFKTPLISSLSEKLEEGGLGIHLVTNLVDSIEYLRTDDKNHLTVEMIIN
jgi:anti-sigma regulatory factor (Ser/Thr protein kinase)